ncbi:hypothetical protein [Botrimarina mediterranea]|uniref:Uncharacterized protein n=1 Tax=Botrimarina mediterranea TaxID=2528022 RepID=A0A518KE48_9BACT|nr:hypothetical protein [Botrimarina mediterranea]QDV76049.1 hypothetical protein Spa11_42730 [Botrimarina mediterranea]QDV80644.1 hypothetical protein K2D_42740 [Planctomycetes bacterium K2D]
MLRSIVAVAVTLTAASFAEAQQTSAYRPQTAMGALGQTGVLYPSAPAGYRVAATNGGGAQRTRPIGNSAKPFNMTNSGPTISPYLNLFRGDDQRSAPNYYTFVRPMQDQADAVRQQQMQMQQLQRQVQQTSYAAPSSSTAGGARYGDTGHYYGGWKR